MADGDREAARDFTAGVRLGDIPESGVLAGLVGDQDVVLVRGSSGFAAVGAKCTHLGAPLEKGVVVGDTLRCPWHHACFDLRTGEAVAAPAFRPLSCWTVEERDGTLRVRAGKPGVAPAARSPGDEKVVIVGGGGGGFAAADALLRLGFAGCITLVSNDSEVGYDRTLLTKDFMDGKVDETRLPIDAEDLAARGATILAGATVSAIEPEAKLVRLTDGTTLPFTKLVLATGAEPKRLTVPGAELSHVMTLRSAGDARAVLAAAAEAARIAIVGSSFIGLETAASLRSRGFDVTVVTPDQHPMQHPFGLALSDAVMAVHRDKGTRFRLGRQVTRIEPGLLLLDDGSTVEADLVVVGIGVSPRLGLAEHAGLAVLDGVLVDERLRSSDRDIYAVGDIARWPDPHSGEAIRVEHWTVAQRQGQVAAMNIAGLDQRFDMVPLFWTKHFDFAIRYVGHADARDEAVLDGDPAAKDCTVRFRKGGRTLAVATVGRDRANIGAELEMERRLGHRAASLPAAGE